MAYICNTLQGRFHYSYFINEKLRYKLINVISSEDPGIKRSSIWLQGEQVEEMGMEPKLYKVLDE